MIKKKLLVCVGSSCHLKGSYHVLRRLKVIIEERELSNKVELQASFCLGNCADGVCIKLGEDIFLHATPDNIDEIFENDILPRL